MLLMQGLGLVTYPASALGCKLREPGSHCIHTWILSGVLAPCARTGKDVANRLVWLPCFPCKETEAKGGKATCPRSHGQCWEGWLWNSNLLALISAQYAKSPDVVKRGGSLFCPCSLLLTARSPPKHRATRGHGPDLEERPPAKLRPLLFLNTWKLISGCFLYRYLSPLHLQSPLPTPPPPAQEKAALHPPQRQAPQVPAPVGGSLPVLLGVCIPQMEDG